jgi:MoxR-like ATPase
MLARALVRSLGLDFNRVQCTPDLLPSDITGVSIYNQKTTEFEFRRGPVFTNILLADEINRATPRTQSSLLECMAESQATVDGVTYPMADIFMVIATQNPVEYQGTYALPEAQLDRFFMRLNLGYPKLDEEVSIMAMQMDHHPIEDLEPVMAATTLAELQARAKAVHIEESVRRYIAQVVQASREHRDVALGASPRGSLALMKAAQAMALMGGKDFVDPQIVKKVAIPVLAHRLITKPQVQLTGHDGAAILSAILNEVPVPVLEN